MTNTSGPSTWPNNASARCLPPPARTSTTASTGAPRLPSRPPWLAATAYPPAQGACSYANICENCTSFHTTRTYLPVLQAQRDDTRTLADDAQHRGWDPETERHLRLINRLNTLMDHIA